MKHIWKKCLPEYYQAVRKRTKTFEIRKDDSDYEIGDILELQEWDGKEYTGHKIAREITYILRDAEQYGLRDGYCILAIQPIGWNEEYYAPAEVTATSNATAIGTVQGDLVIQKGQNNKHIVNNGTMTMTFGK